MAIGTDRVQALKYEEAAKGGNAADDSMGIPSEIEPQEDVLESCGYYVQDAANRDENVYIDRDGDDLRFRDVNNPVPVTLSTLASASAPTLNTVITGGTPNNDVNIPLANPVIWRDNAAAVIPLSIIKTEATVAALDITTSAITANGVAVRTATAVVNLRSEGLIKTGGGVLDIRNEVANQAVRVLSANVSSGTPGFVQIKAGDNTGGPGGNVSIQAGSGSTTGGLIQIGTSGQASFISVGNAGVQTDVQIQDRILVLGWGSLDGTVNKVNVFNILDDQATVPSVNIITVDANPNGQVTEPQGTIAIDPVTPALYQNTDGATAWAAVSASGVTLSSVINAASPANDVNIPVANPVIFRDNALAVVPLSVDRTAAGVALSVKALNNAQNAISVTDNTVSDEVVIRSSSIRKINGIGTFTISTDIFAGPLAILGGPSTSASPAGDVTIAGGNNSSTGSGGDLFLRAGGSGSGFNGTVQVGVTNTDLIFISATTKSTIINGVVTVVGDGSLDGTVNKTTGIQLQDQATNVPTLRVLTVDANPNGQVTEARGSLAIEPTTPAIYQNQDGATAWAQFVAGDKKTYRYVVGNTASGDTLDDVDFLDTGDGQAIVDAITAAGTTAGNIFIRAGTYNFASGAAGASLPLTTGAYTITGEGNSTQITTDDVNRTLATGFGTIWEKLRIIAGTPSPGATGTSVIDVSFGKVLFCTFDALAPNNISESLDAHIAAGQNTIVDNCTFNTTPSSNVGDGWCVRSTSTGVLIARSSQSQGKGFATGLTQGTVNSCNLVQTSGNPTGQIVGGSECQIFSNKILPFGTTTPQIVIGLRSIASNNIINGIFNPTTKGVVVNGTDTSVSDNVILNVFGSNGIGVELAVGAIRSNISGNQFNNIATPINDLGNGSNNHNITDNSCPVNLPGSRVRTLTTGFNQPVLMSDKVLFLDTSGGAITVQMPLAANVPPGFRISFKRINNFVASQAFLVRQGANLIDGGTSYTFPTTAPPTPILESWVSDGSNNWYKET